MKDFLGHVENFIKLEKMNVAGKTAGIFGSYGYDGAWVMEERLKEYVQGLGYKIYDKICVKVDAEFRVNQSAILSDCRTWGKEFAEYLK